MKSKIIFVSVMVALLAACGEKKQEQIQETNNTESQMNIEITPIDFQKAYDEKSGSVNILDVRTMPEYAGGRVPGAKFLSLQEIQALGPNAVPKIPFSKEEPLYVICATGNRSVYATQMLRSLGYAQAVSVAGGTMMWMRSGRPLER